MSFILDAIAKSERERQQQQAPDARSLAFPAAAPVRSRSLAPLVLAGSLLLASAILAAVWMQTPRPQATPFAGPGGAPVPAAPDTAGKPQAPIESRDAPPPAAPLEAPRPAAAKPMLAESSAAKPLVQEPPAAGIKMKEALAAGSAIDAPATRSSGDGALETASLAPVDEAGAAESRRAGLEPDPGASGAAAGEPAPPAGEAPRRRVSRLRDLPADVRQALPSVVFTGHLYSRNPRASYVFVDGGRQVVVGQQIVDDLVLDEITPTGVVVEFQGYLIEVGVLQNWSLK